MSTTVAVETYRYQLVRARLVECWPELDTETLTDTLEGNH